MITTFEKCLLSLSMSKYQNVLNFFVYEPDFKNASNEALLKYFDQDLPNSYRYTNESELFFLTGGFKGKGLFYAQT